jgi:hypothetical protein
MIRSGAPLVDVNKTERYSFSGFFWPLPLPLFLPLPLSLPFDLSAIGISFL